VDRQDGKRQLRRLREQRGWSWADEARAIKEMARRLGIDRLAQTNIASIKRTIARWESDTAAATVPDERYQWVLAHMFAECDRRFDVGPGSDLLGLLSAFEAMGLPLARIAELQDAVTTWIERSGHTPLTQLHRQPLDAASIAEATISFAAINQRVGSVPFVRSQLALAPFLVALGRIGEASSAVHTLAARAFALAGGVRRALRPWDGERFVSDFDDHLYAALFD
jgi:transcriptional regulator with XRE-family HTH domain